MRADTLSALARAIDRKHPVMLLDDGGVVKNVSLPESGAVVASAHVLKLGIIWGEEVQYVAGFKTLVGLRGAAHQNLIDTSFLKIGLEDRSGFLQLLGYIPGRLGTQPEFHSGIEERVRYQGKNRKETAYNQEFRDGEASFLSRTLQDFRFRLTSLVRPSRPAP